MNDEALCKSGIYIKKPRHNRLAQFLVLFLQAALNVQQVIHFLLKLFLGGPERTELLVLSLQIILRQAALLGLLLDFQRHILHLREMSICQRNLFLVNNVTFIITSFFSLVFWWMHFLYLKSHHGPDNSVSPPQLTGPCVCAAHLVSARPVYSHSPSCCCVSQAPVFGSLTGVWRLAPPLASAPFLEGSHLFTQMHFPRGQVYHCWSCKSLLCTKQHVRTGEVN